jgi:hypothetical protein
VAPELSHQRLTETHHFTFAFPCRIEVTPAFTAAHRQGGERVFKRLLKAEEFQDRQVHGRVKRMPPLNGPMAELNCTRQARLTWT